MEFVRQILMKLKTSSNEGLLMKVFSHSLMWLSKHCSGHYVTTQACTLISWGCVHLRWCGSLEDDTLCCLGHYGDIIMGAIASQITSLSSVYSTVYSDADQRKHQSSASLAFVREIHRGPAQGASNAENVSIWWRHHRDYRCTASVWIGI